MKTRPNYAILDAAKMLLEIEEAKKINNQHVCLYKGDRAEQLGQVAPWLFVYKQDSQFAKWLYKNAQEQSWGVFFYCEKDFKEVYAHFRKFLLIQTEEGKEKYFRYYDPRVLNVFLPSCEPQQLKEFFGPVEAYFAETQLGDVNVMTFPKEAQKLEEMRLSWLNFYFPRKPKSLTK